MPTLTEGYYQVEIKKKIQPPTEGGSTMVAMAASAGTKTRISDARP